MIQKKMRELIDENLTYSMKLCAEDRAFIRRICNHLRVSRFCGYQTGVLRKDLIEMSLETAARGELLKDVLSVFAKEFCPDRLFCAADRKSLHRKPGRLILFPPSDILSITRSTGI